SFSQHGIYTLRSWTHIWRRHKQNHDPDPEKGTAAHMPTTLTPDLLLSAYRQGIFPMSESRADPDIFWVDPQRRGIFPLDGFHISRSLARTLRGGRFSV